MAGPIHGGDLDAACEYENPRPGKNDYDHNFQHHHPADFARAGDITGNTRRPRLVLPRASGRRKRVIAMSELSSTVVPVAACMSSATPRRRPPTNGWASSFLGECGLAPDCANLAIKKLMRSPAGLEISCGALHSV